MCEYCEKDYQNSKPILNEYAIDIIVDDTFIYAYCECGKHIVAKVNFCPMCR